MALGADTFKAGGNAVSDLFGAFASGTKAKGNRLQAEQYDLAAELALKNKQFAETSTAIKEQQTQRGIETVIGQQQADVAAGGFAATGSALDLLRDSMSQGALTKAVVGQQGLIEEAGFQEQADSFKIMAQSARLAADAEGIAGIGKFVSAGVNTALAVATLSDIRLKRDIVLIGRRVGLGIYRFRYLWSDQTFIGVMAQEVLRLFPRAVVRGRDGWLRVDYTALGCALKG
jgi:hypothetical protein